MTDFSNGNYERSSKFADENAKCRVVFEREATVIYGFTCKIARTNVKVGKTILLALVELRALEQAFNSLLVG